MDLFVIKLKQAKNTGIILQVEPILYIKALYTSLGTLCYIIYKKKQKSIFKKLVVKLIIIQIK